MSPQYDYDDTISPHPGSPPGMTTSKSSISSSFQSLNSDDGSVLADASHFEDIGLDDDNATLKAGPRAVAGQRDLSPSSSTVGRNLAAPVRPGPRPRQSFPNLRSSSMTSNPRSTSLAVLSDPRPLSLPRLSTGSRSTTSLPLARKSQKSPGRSPHRTSNRSPSPGLSPNPRDPNIPHRPRRGSWQVNRERKSFAELEHECDEDDGDDIPDGLFLDNVPLSPRPQNDRPPSRSASRSGSAEPPHDRANKERVRSVGNGTPPVAQASGSLRSPTWKTDGSQPPRSPSARAHSWSSVHDYLSPETKALSEKLEEHADELDEEYSARMSGSNRPNTWNASRTPADRHYDKKERVKSSTPELPPLRRTNIMIDPLPVSKEKEAVLSRTRPSWLPPKDPAEEKRHLKEYQKMMVASQRAGERREAARKAQIEVKDSAADDLMRMWETSIIPRWNDAINEKKTRELWWYGIPPRSRGIVWQRAFGNSLELSEASFGAALERADALEARVKEDKASAEDLRRMKWFEQIRADVGSHTLPGLKIFGVDGPLHGGLVDVLRAYAMYRSDIGYVPGCNTIAALLLLNLPSTSKTFLTLANVLNRPLPLSFHAADQGAQTSVYNLILSTLAHKSPSLHTHLTTNLANVSPDRYLHSMLISLFTRDLAVDEAARLWDVYAFEGDAVLVRAAVAVLLEKEMGLLGCSTDEEVMDVMSRRGKNGGGIQSPGAGGGSGEGVDGGLNDGMMVMGEREMEDAFMRRVREAGKE